MDETVRGFRARSEGPRPVSHNGNGLINGLKRFCTSENPSATPGAESPSPTRLTRVNSYASPICTEYGGRSSASRRPRKTQEAGQHATSEDLKAATKELGSMLKEMEVLLQGRNEIKKLKRGTTYLKLFPGCSEKFRLTLLDRPCKVIVTVEKTTSCSAKVGLYGSSTHNDSPSEFNHNLNGGKNGAIVYDHVLPPMKEGGELVDRRVVPPACVELYVAIFLASKLGAEGCEFKIKVSMVPANVTLTQLELKQMIGQQGPQTWRRKLEELKGKGNEVHGACRGGRKFGG